MKALRQKLSVKKYHQRKDRDFETLLLDHITDGKLWSGKILDNQFLFQYFGYEAGLVRHSQTIVFDCEAFNVWQILTAQYKLLQVIYTVRIIAYR